MSILHVNEVRIPVGDEVILWGARGIEGWLYPTKIAAEIAARHTFPIEGEAERYARIYYKRFMEAG